MTEERKLRLALYKHKYWLKLVLRPGLIRISKITPFNSDELKEESEKLMSFGFKSEVKYEQINK